MTESEYLELLATLSYGSCKHNNRVNVCSACCELLTKIVKAAYPQPAHKP